MNSYENEKSKERRGSTDPTTQPVAIQRSPQPGAGNSSSVTGVSETAPYAELQSSYGNAAVAQSLSQSEGESRSIAATAAGLIVEDTTETLGPGQMRKSEFLAQLRASVCSATAEALADTPWSEAGCPYIDRWFGRYGAQSGDYIERSIRRYAPEAAGASAASGYIPAITARVSQAVSVWATTGEITGVPGGVSPGSLGGGLMGAVGSAVSGAASGVNSAVSGVASGIGSGAIFFKEREGGASEAGDPQAIQSQLGAGQSLDGDVKSRMESAFNESFADVRVHSDTNAAGLSEHLNARAFTIGNHVAFGAGEYQPGTLIGDALIAHELAHVTQQRGAGEVVKAQQTGGGGYSALEEEADRSAVGAVLSLQGDDRKPLKSLAGRVLPAVRSGLRLQQCKKREAPLTPIPTPKAGQSYEEWLMTFPKYSGSDDRDITSAAPADLKNLIVNKLGAPPDCADVSLLLRHYYLKSQGKTLTFKAGPEKKEFRIGYGVTDKEVGVCMIQLGTINFQEDRPGFRLVKYYKKAGAMIRNLKELINAGLKPGDPLVWKRLPGLSGNFEGHVQTIQAIDVANGLLTVVQGNMIQGTGVGQLQQRQYTFKQLTDADDGNADIKDAREESFYGAGPWME
jgi:hypothetical protein